MNEREEQHLEIKTKRINEKDLHRLKHEVLEESRHTLCHNLNPRDHLPYLRSNGIFTQSDEEDIIAKTTTVSKVGTLVDILQTKGPHGFDILCQSLLDNKTQIFLLTKLNVLLEDKITRLIGNVAEPLVPTTTICSLPGPDIVEPWGPTTTICSEPLGPTTTICSESLVATTTVYPLHGPDINTVPPIHDTEPPDSCATITTS